MRSLAALVVVLCSGCTLWFNGGDDAPDICAVAEDTKAEPAIAMAPLRDPGNLTCQGFSSPCNDECGPCPAATEPAVAGVKPIPPIPSWNYCGHVCETKSETACAADPQCRVIKDAECAIGNMTCFTDFLGCFPVDTIPDVSVMCHGADAWDCSRSAACTAIHSGACGSGMPDCDRPFELCVPEGTIPGSCRGTVTCDRVTPACPPQTTPGISGGCYTGACIPTDLCGPSI
jgi:hypothetical protein